jgi:hypothetical protein
VLSNGDLLDGISCPAANTCFAVGWPGAIYMTADGGSTWNYEANAFSGADETYAAVSCWSVTGCVAVGTDGIAISTGNGSTWSTGSSGTAQQLTGVACANSYACVAVGLSGETLTRTGGTWHPHQSGTANLFGVSCATSSSCRAVGEAGTVLATANGGTSWAAQSSSTLNNLYGIQCTPSGACVAAGAAGTAALTRDGTTWATIPVPPLNSLLAAAFTGSGQAELAGLGGTIISSSSLLTSCAGAAASPTPSPPQPAGAVVQFTATSTGCPNPLYEFWLQYPNGTWVMMQGFGPSATWSWNTTGVPAGTYTIHAWANQAGGSPATWEAFGEVKYQITTPPPCFSANLSPASPSAPAGTLVALTATSTGCPNPRYEFWAQAAGGTWSLLQGWGGSTFNFVTTGLAPGTYNVHVWANQAGDPTATWEAYGSDTVTLTGCTSASLSPSNPSGPAGTTILLTAGSAGCPTPVYEYWVQYLNGGWYLVQRWSGTGFSWNTSHLAPGVYTVHVWANELGADQSTWEAFASQTVTLTGCTTASLSPSAGSSNIGLPIPFTASETGCASPQFEFWLKAPAGTWYLVQSFGGSSTWQWDTTGWARGTYTVHVWANNLGADTSTWEAYGSATWTLT